MYLLIGVSFRTLLVSELYCVIKKIKSLVVTCEAHVCTVAICWVFISQHLVARPQQIKAS